MSGMGGQLITAIREVAADSPDFIYSKPADYFRSKCVYVVDGKPSCLIGHAVWNLGLIDSSLERSGYNDCSAEELVNHLEMDVDGRELRWLEVVQYRQDQGVPWAWAVARADFHVEGWEEEDEY